MKKCFKILLSLLFIVLLQSCATTKKPVSVHGDKPLIDTAKIIVDGRAGMDKKIIDGPKPYDTIHTIADCSCAFISSSFS